MIGSHFTMILRKLCSWRFASYDSITLRTHWHCHYCISVHSIRNEQKRKTLPLESRLELLVNSPLPALLPRRMETRYDCTFLKQTMVSFRLVGMPISCGSTVSMHFIQKNRTERVASVSFSGAWHKTPLRRKDHPRSLVQMVKAPMREEERTIIVVDEMERMGAVAKTTTNKSR